MTWLQRLSLLLALLWMAALFYLSNQPTLETPHLFSGQDKLFHMLAYAVLGFLLLGARKPLVNGFSNAQVGGSILVASLYGISDEVHQYFVPGRSADPWDWVADTLGAVIAVSLLGWFSRKWKTSVVVREGV
ncbi:MAG TPA: VanZ family protein [Gammaproteobacteria bacterium]|nr:VanZ family protein [Gammaproteobacteria bacterium]